MDRDFLIELFAEFGPVTVRRMFSGFGISADGTNFAMVIRDGLYLRADETTWPRFEAEGSKPFQYQTSKRSVTVQSYWQLPERLYDDPQELADWARAALAAAQRAAFGKRSKARKTAKAASPKKSSVGKKAGASRSVRGKSAGKKAGASKTRAATRSR